MYAPLIGLEEGEPTGASGADGGSWSPQDPSRVPAVLGIAGTWEGKGGDVPLRLPHGHQGSPFPLLTTGEFVHLWGPS